MTHLKFIFYNIDLPQHPAISFLSIYPKDISSHHKVSSSAMFISALFIIFKNWKQTGCPSIDEWIRKWGVFTQQTITQLLKTMTS